MGKRIIVVFVLILNVLCCFSQVLDVVKCIKIDMFYVNGDNVGKTFNEREINYKYGNNGRLIGIDYVEYDNFVGDVYRIKVETVGKEARRLDYANDKVMRDDSYVYMFNEDGMLCKKIKSFNDSDDIPNRIITEYVYNKENKLEYLVEYQEYDEGNGFCEYEDSYTMGFIYNDGEMCYGCGTNHNSRNNVTNSFEREPKIDDWMIEYTSYSNDTNINYFTFIEEFCNSIYSSSRDIEFATVWTNVREDYLIEKIYETKYKTAWKEMEYEFDENDKLVGFKVYLCTSNTHERKLFTSVAIRY